MDKLVRNLYRLLTGLSCVSMVAAFLIVLLGVLSRQVSFIDVQGSMPMPAMRLPRRCSSPCRAPCRTVTTSASR